MIADLKLALRQFIKFRGVTATAVLILALGIGACTAMFSVIEAAMLRPMRALERDRLVAIWGTNARLGIPRFSQSVPNYFDLREHATSFTGVGAARDFSANLTDHGPAVRLEGGEVSASFLELLGLRPTLGRGFTAADDRPGAPRVAILSGNCWRDRFAADPAVLGRKLLINGEPHEIVGVIEDSRRLQPAEIWRPLGLEAKDGPRTIDCMLLVIARLKPGVSPAAAQAEMDAFSASIRATYPDYEGWNLRIERLYDVLVTPDQQRGLVLLCAAVGCVLLICCSNIASLLLARALARDREIAIRLALGASRGQIVRQLLTESGLLAAAGGGAGMVLSFWGVALFRSAWADTIAGAATLRVDGGSLAFAAVACVAVTLASGLAPAWRSARCNAGAALSGGTRTIGGNRRSSSLRSLFVIAQFALSSLLLVVAGLLGRSFHRLEHTDPGIRTRGVMMFQIAPRPEQARTQAARNAYFDDLLDRLREIPGVVRVGRTSMAPFDGGNTSNTLRPADPAAVPAGTALQVAWRSASPEYFRTLGIPLLEGRTFTRADTDGAPAVLIVSRQLARKLWPGQSAVGKRVYPTPWDRAYTIIGVVADASLVNLAGDSAPLMYFSAASWSWDTTTIALQTSVAPASLTAAIRSTVQRFDRNQPVFNFHTIDELIDGQLRSPRFDSALLAAFAAIAVALAAVGIYGVMAGSVVRRTGEIGVRKALGAQGADVLRLILGAGLRLALIGAAIGLAAGFLAARFLGSLLYQTRPTEPLVYGAAGVGLTAVALLACFLPARRAMRLNPVEALRAE